jgi:hypothetical protein
MQYVLCQSDLVREALLKKDEMVGSLIIQQAVLAQAPSTSRLLSQPPPPRRPKADSFLSTSSTGSALMRASYSPINQFDDAAGAASPSPGRGSTVPLSLSATLGLDGMDEGRPVYHADSMDMSGDGDLSTVVMSSTDTNIPHKSKRSFMDFLFMTGRNSEYIIQGANCCSHVGI